SLRPAVRNRHIATLGIAGFAQALVERTHSGRVCAGRSGVKETDHRHRRLLRARRKRPRCHTADKRDELAALHSITSSARAMSVGGTVRPSALAVLTLMTISIFVENSIGRSPGFAPFRILSTNAAARRHPSLWLTP